MNRSLIVLTCWLFCSAALGDDAADAEAKVREYFDVFNDKDVDGILERIYSVPVHIGNGSGHRAYQSTDDARASLGSLFGQIEGQGWVRSVIREVKPCVISDGLVFAEVNYTRDKSDGTAITPGLRSNVYVVQKLESGWRITAFYARDPAKGFQCGRR